MKKYLVLSDLDDTLLTKKKNIKAYSRHYIRRFVKKGNIFSLATGRPYQGALPFYKMLKINGPLVCDNGASIYLPNEDGTHSVKKFSMDLELFKELMKETYEYLDSAFSGGDHELCFYHKEKVPFWIVHRSENHIEKEGPFHEILNEAPLLPSIYVKEEYLDDFLNVLKKEKYNSIHYRMWGVYDKRASFELFSKEASKGNALLYLKNYYHIEEDCTFAFGDQRNDESMLESAYYGVAMINGNKEVIEKCQYVTKYDQENNGEVRKIKQILKERKKAGKY